MTRTTEIAFAALLLVACAKAEAGPAPVGVNAPSSGEARLEFELDSLDERPVSAAATRGKPTVLVITDTGSILGQAELQFVVAMAKNDGEATNYAWVVLAPRSNRAEVEAWIATLGIKFPVAFADTATMANAGPFGELHGLPTTLVLDRVGRVAFRAEGRVAKSDELRGVLTKL